MGGNARATNKITGQDTLAQKIPLKEIGRARFIKKFIEIFEELDSRFEKKYGRPIWANKSILKNGVAFNGSTSFIMNPEISDDEVVPFKPTSGDLDIMVKESDKEDLWHLLDELESSPNFMQDVEYKGSNKLHVRSIGDQINSVFEVKFGDIVTQSQVDFEFTAFEGEGENEAPEEYSRFSHSSSLSDAQQGFKGVAHKYLIRALAGAASTRDNVLVKTDKSTYDKPRFKKFAGTVLTQIRMQKFDLNKGLRTAYEAQMTPDGEPWYHEGKRVYVELKTKDSSFENTLTGMYKLLFGDLDDKNDVDKMWSFVGIVDLMKKRLDKKSVEETYERFINLCFGEGSQKLERDSKDTDFQIKISAVNYMIKEISSLKKFDKVLQKMIDTFYATYDSVKMSESELHGNDFRGLVENYRKKQFINRERGFEAEQERKVRQSQAKMDNETHHVYIDGKIWMKGGVPVEFKNKKHAYNTAVSIRKKDMSKKVQIAHHTYYKGK